MPKYTSDEIDILEKNFVKYGPKYCNTLLPHRTSDSIYAYAVKRLKLKRCGSKTKHPSMQNIDYRIFNNIDSKIAYFLGFFYADGSIINYKSSNKLNNTFTEHHAITLEFIKSDYEDIKYIFDYIGKWAVQTRTRQESWQPTIVLSSNNKYLFDLFYSWDFYQKSVGSPSKVLDSIPAELHVCFWRGFFDGDGCISFSGKYPRIKFSGHYDCDWGKLQSFITSITGINYSVYKENKKYKSSTIRVQSTESCKILITKLLECPHGLSRKTEKMKMALDL